MYFVVFNSVFFVICDNYLFAASNKTLTKALKQFFHCTSMANLFASVLLLFFVACLLFFVVGCCWLFAVLPCCSWLLPCWPRSGTCVDCVILAGFFCCLTRVVLVVCWAPRHFLCVGRRAFSGTNRRRGNQVIAYRRQAFLRKADFRTLFLDPYHHADYDPKTESKRTNATTAIMANYDHFTINLHLY